MSRKSTRLLKAALSLLHYSRADEMLAPLTGGRGVIFTLHHVSTDPVEDFEPNRILKITPEFLDAVLYAVQDWGFDVVTLDDIPSRLNDGANQRPFCCFTFDDGYRDNRDQALPVFRRHNLPFTIFVPTDFPDGKGDLWWLVLEQVIRSAPSIVVDLGSGPVSFQTGTVAEKEHAFHEIYWALRRMDEGSARALVADLAIRHDVDGRALADRILMTWDELRALSKDPLVSFGAHTCGHFALAKLSDDEARREITQSIARLEAGLGKTCRHFSYPYGDPASAGARDFDLVRETGMLTGVTTRKGLVQSHHRADLMSLPRVSLNGDYQDTRFVKVLLSGAPFALRSAVKRLTGSHAAA